MLVDSKLIIERDSNKAQVFGRWSCQYGQILPIKGNIDSWNENTTYKISSYTLSENDAKKHFLEAATIGTVPDIFRRIQKLRAKRVYIPYVVYGKGLLSINHAIQSLNIKSLSFLDSVDVQNVLDFNGEADRIAPSANFMSTDFSYSDLSFRANHDGIKLPNQFNVVFVSFWQFSYSYNGEDCFAYLQDRIGANVVFLTNLPHYEDFETKKSQLTLGTKVYRAVIIPIIIILVYNIIMNLYNLFNELIKDAIVFAIIHYLMKIIGVKLDNFEKINQESKREKYISEINKRKEQDAMELFGVKIIAKSK